jgi:hypothetical protein
MRHKTTTRPRRNTRSITALAEHFQSNNITRITLLDVGPGMAVKYIGRLSAIQHPFDVFRRFEVGLRAILPLPVSAYESYEPNEILQIFEEHMGIQVEISLLDIDVTVLAVAWNQLGVRARSLIPADISVFPNESLIEYAGRFDVVIAQTVLSRIKTAQGRFNAARNLVSLSRPGGILTCSSEEMAKAGCAMEHPLAPAYCASPLPA